LVIVTCRCRKTVAIFLLEGGKMAKQLHKVKTVDGPCDGMEFGIAELMPILNVLRPLPVFGNEMCSYTWDGEEREEGIPVYRFASRTMPSLGRKVEK
jgi:hypothetical protein